MSSAHGHKQSGSVTQNRKAQLANAYNELGKELSSEKIRVVGNYTLGKVIGEGAYGKVRMGVHRLTSTCVAIKQIPKAMSSSLTREIHHHRQLHHPHITQMYEVIATETNIWIVTELCRGGELFDYLVEKGRLSEDETRIIFGQLCLAVAYLHDNGIVHRDLKLENVLLDERCRVKLGDFGFTREFDKNMLMETFCGTTGYASPEMLQGKKYVGPEVDVWSLGIILYCLLTGTLPFDDDDDSVMRSMIIQGEFEDPTWLSLESRNLIKDVLQKDVTKRLTIPQILAHPWFTVGTLTYEPDLLSEVLVDESESSARHSESTDPDSHNSSEASTQSSDHLRANDSTAPTTPGETSTDPFEINGRAWGVGSVHRKPSDSTIRNTSQPDIAYSLRIKTDNQPETVDEEPVQERPSSSPLRSSASTGSKAPPVHPVRTPARTKRRSISSNLSDPDSPVADKTPTPLPLPAGRDLDFSSLLSKPSPIIFSTPMERELLNTLSTLGFDTAQTVHSVLSDACDAAGAVWWMLKKKAEKGLLDDGDPRQLLSPVSDNEAKPSHPERKMTPKKKRNKTSVGVQTDPPGMHLSLARSAPQLAFVPPTPTAANRPSTPPNPVTPTRPSMLSPSSSTVADLSIRSYPSTPGSSMKDKDGSKGRKPRSGSVSIMQRATTALEAAGIVRKKSSEAVKEEKDKDKERDRERSRETERRIASGEESRSSHGSGSSKLTKSPPLKPTKEYVTPTTPPPHEQPATHIGSPWVLADSRDSLSHPGSSALASTAVPSEMLQSQSAPNFFEKTPLPKPTAGPRHRANLLTAFRLWFHEDRKGKRKDMATASTTATAHTSFIHPSTGLRFGTGTGKRRGSTGSNYGNRTGTGHRTRPSFSSRRSSSVNSRRSSGTSVQMLVLDSPQIPTRRSIGSHTPNSERGEYSSRPSSIRSLSMQPRHRKSPSTSSIGSTHYRAASPMQKYHRRGGSGSSTRVVRQIQSNRPPHARSNSAASSIHSPPSSRPTSYYEPSESEGPRTASPYKTRKRSYDDTARRSNATTFIAQKRQGPFTSPGHNYTQSMGRSSWKKAWGLEPPGWQSRTAHLPIEVLAISPAEPASLRDVFSGRQSLNLGDESDWVDEDEDVPAFAGGVGQMGTPASISNGGLHMKEPTITLSPAPRSHRTPTTAKRTNRAGSSPGAASNPTRQKTGHSPVERVSPIPPDNLYEPTDPRGGRRQLPTGRSGPAFRHPIQEEDEGEEE